MCGRCFARGNSLKQHTQMAHKSGAMVEKNKRSRAQAKRGGGRRGGNRNGTLGADIAPSRIPAPRGNTITVDGEDRLIALDIKKGASVFTNVDIGPGVSQRLGTIARAYQRIRWNSVKVIVTPQASAMTNGGYVCGFIMDPEDKTITARDLSATQGSQTKKWYESAVVQMPRKTDLLYTSPGEEPRLSVPSTFWIVGEGPPSSDLSVIVTFLWSVTLSNPTMEDISNLSFNMKGEMRGLKDNFCLSWFNENSPSGTVDCSGLMSDGIRALQGNHFFRVPTFIIEYSEGTGDTGSIQAHFIVYKSDDHKMYYSSNGRDIIKTKWQGDVEADQVLVPCNTYCKYVGPGNPCQAVSSPQPSLYTSGPNSAQNWAQLIEEFQRVFLAYSELKNSSKSNLIESNASSMEKLEKPDL